MGLDPMPAELASELAAPNRRTLLDPRTMPVRYSRLRAFARSALHYLQSCQEDSEDTFARKLGRGAHALVLDQPVVVWDEKSDSGRTRPRNGKDWDAFKAEHAGAEILNAKEYAQAKGIADAVQRDKFAAQLLYSSELELELNWTHPLGRKCASHIDIYRRGKHIADLKTTRDASPGKFGRSAFWDHYHAQLGFYSQAIESVGHPRVPAFILAVENEPPYAVQVYELSDDALDAGRRLCDTWLEQLLLCESIGTWPPYAQAIIVLELPDTMLTFSSLDSESAEL